MSVFTCGNPEPDPTLKHGRYMSHVTCLPFPHPFELTACFSLPSKIAWLASLPAENKCDWRELPWYSYCTLDVYVNLLQLVLRSGSLGGEMFHSFDHPTAGRKKRNEYGHKEKRMQEREILVLVLDSFVNNQLVLSSHWNERWENCTRESRRGRVQQSTCSWLIRRWYKWALFVSFPHQTSKMASRSFWLISSVISRPTDWLWNWVYQKQPVSIICPRTRPLPDEIYPNELVD